MKASPNGVVLTASDLVLFAGCAHRSALDLAVAGGLRDAPADGDSGMEPVREGGLDHERRHVAGLREQGLTVAGLGDLTQPQAVAATREHLRTGTPVILHGALRDQPWAARPDILRRVAGTSALGNWSYEVFGTELDADTEAATVLELALQSDLLAKVQGVAAASVHVVTPDPGRPVRTYRLADYAAHFRRLRDGLLRMAGQAPEAALANTYPEPVEHCTTCRWRRECDDRRHADDHLSLVAGISRLQRRELTDVGVTTLTQLAKQRRPIPFRPRRGSAESFIGIQDQAWEQLHSRETDKPRHRFVESGCGPERLPLPSPGDVFLDLNSAAFADDGGRTYLFGLATGARDGSVTTRAFWARDGGEERRAFEATVDEILRAWEVEPRLHVYHYGPSTLAALKRLAGRHGTREASVDRMLRADLFVDVDLAVRHAVRAGVEAYTLHDLQPFHGHARVVSPFEARTAARAVERARRWGGFDQVTAEVRAVVEAHNRDQVLSTRALRNWLETLRADLEQRAGALPRPTPRRSEGRPGVDASVDQGVDGGVDQDHGADDDERRRRALLERLTAGVPADARARDEEQRARWLLAQLLGWHRRADLANEWEFLRLRGLPAEDLLEERAALAGLTLAHRFTSRHGQLDTYAFPAQDAEFRVGDEVRLDDGALFGVVAEVDTLAWTITIEKKKGHINAHPPALFIHRPARSPSFAKSLLRLGEDVAERGLTASRGQRAARDLLLRRPPRLKTATFTAMEGESAEDFAIRIACDLDHGVLSVQGPPGSGKTQLVARMICELLARGARVGVTGVSHELITWQIRTAWRLANKLKVKLEPLHRVKDRNDGGLFAWAYDNKTAFRRLASGEANVLGGLPALWASPEGRHAADVLFVDDAGELPLADVLAVCQGAKSVVLIGDPARLEPPRQGGHADGADPSALGHVLGDARTMPADRGILLPETGRLSPAICAFTSEVFYEGRLRARAGREHQTLDGTGLFDGGGLWFVPVEHDGNRTSSLEETAAVEAIVARLVGEGSSWIDDRGDAYLVQGHDVLVIAPYPAQIALLDARLRVRQVQIGTADKFRGHEAIVVIYSLTSSSAADAPGGIEFLFDLNRLNAATSRPQCATIVVASPRLLQVDCESPHQMRLASALCRYVELARTVRWPPPG